MERANKNKLIMKFMGYNIDRLNFTDTKEHGIFNTTSAKYDTDWNWIMPVVEKIESLGFEFFIVENRCKINHNTDNSIENIIDFTLNGSKLEATYLAVVEFIDKFNKNSVKCSVTGEKMLGGYYLTNEERYIKYENDLIKWLRDRNVDADNELSDEFIINEAYDIGELELIEFN